MPKNDDLTKHQYDIYRKTHGYDHPIEEEQAKIARERGNYARLRRQGEERVKRGLSEIASPADVEDWEEDPARVEEERAARELRNAHTHKRRLKGLARHVEADESTEGGA